MKNQRGIISKNLASLTLSIIVLIFASCTDDKNKTTAGQDNPSTQVLKPKSPAIDLFTATLMGDIKTIRAHILTGTDLDRKDTYGSSPLMIAATFGKTEAAKALVEGGADVNGRNNDGSTPLHTAAFFCRTEIVQLLLKNGAEKDLENSYGSTALESVSGPFESVKPIYDQLSSDLGPLGLKLDYTYLEATRPEIVRLLQ